MKLNAQAQEATADETQAQEAGERNNQQAKQGGSLNGEPATLEEAQGLIANLRSAISDLRKENAGRRKAEQEAQAQAQADEEKRLQEQQQWQQLAEQRATRIGELEPKAQAYDALSQEITSGLEAEIAAWPEEIKALRPANADAAGLMNWAKAARPVAQKLIAPGHQPPAVGQTPTPKAAGGSSAEERRRQQQAAERVRSTF